MPILHLAAAILIASTSEYDLVISGGRVVDGTGAPWFRADIGVSGDRIRAVGDLSRATAARRIDAGGLVVAPGFIDMLGQSELAALVDNRLESKVRQGITTEIDGEGNSIAPVDPTILTEWGAYLRRFSLTVDWTDLDGYGRRLEKGGSSINIATFVGATSIRRSVMGAADVQPTPEQLEAMQALLAKELQQGGLGLGSSLIYPPATYARTSELITLARVAARHGGVYATHLRSEAADVLDALEEAITVGREAHIPVEIWHLKVAGRENWGRMKDVVSRIERARVEGVDIAANVYPYTAAMNGLAASVPAWAQSGGTTAMLARLRDAKLRPRIERELWTGPLGRESADGIQLVVSPAEAVRRYLGWRVADVARELGKTPEDALLDLLLASEGKIGVIRYVMDESDLRFALARPWVAVSTDSAGMATDGPFGQDRAHPRAFGSMPRVLARYVSETRLLTLEEAVRRMTSLPASRVRLFDRGLLRPGMAADITVFDPERVMDLATYDQPTRYAEGIHSVVVNGKVVLDAGRLTSERPGRLLRRDGKRVTGQPSLGSR